MANYINWTNGMKLSKVHFSELQSAVWVSVAEARSLAVTDYSFGISNSSGLRKSLYVDVVVIQPNIIEVHIKSLNGVTRNGNWIAINEPDEVSRIFKLDQLELKDENTKYYAVVSADYGTPNPIGTPIEGEVPVRLPYSRPSYTIDLLPENQLGELQKPANLLPVASFLIQKGRIKRLEEYIAPVISVADSADIAAFLEGYSDSFFKLSECCIETLSKARNKERLTPLYKNAIFLCERTLPVAEREVHQLRHKKGSLRPIQFLISANCVAQSIRNSLLIIDPKEREELLNYIAEQTALTAGEYNSMLNSILTFQYDHWNLEEMLTTISGFSKITLQLFTKIMESEYVGKKKDSGMIIDEQSAEGSESKKRKGWQF